MGLLKKAQKIRDKIKSDYSKLDELKDFYPGQQISIKSEQEIDELLNRMEKNQYIKNQE